jgi:type IV secretion system protein VirB10
MTDKNTGALPPLDEEFSAPRGEARTKTNVGKFTLLVMMLVAFLFLLTALLLWVKNRQGAGNATPNAAVVEKPGYAQKNEEVESASIDSTKAQIRKAEEEQAALEARIQAEMEEAARRAREEEEARRRLLEVPAQPEAAAATEETPEERMLRTHVLLPISGSAPRGNVGNPAESDPTPGDVDKAAQRQREFETRMQALGLGAASMGDGALGGFAAANGDNLGGRLRASNLPATAAGRLPNLDYLLKKGTLIPCALKTGINTQLPGFVLCNVISDVYSANGKTLLIERGATLFGEQQSSLKKGQARTFVIWSRVDNPSGVSAEINSPGTDAMGYSGIPGIVDHHFMARFGAAVLLTLIKDFSKAAADRYAERSETNVNLGGDGNDVNSLAEEALKDSIGIPPNLIVKPAAVVHVLVARDVSFEGVYEIIQ